VTRTLCLAPLELYLAAALGVVAVVGLVTVAVEVLRRRPPRCAKRPPD
jgi:hypothetical protein